MISTHVPPFHAINSQHQFHNKNNYVSIAYSDNQVKLFSMLQVMHTTIHNQKYVIININPYHKKQVVATYPLEGGRREGSRVHLPRKENARSHHQHLFEENVRKIGKMWSMNFNRERFGSCFYAQGRY